MKNPITQQQAEQLLDGTTEGPWITYTGSFGRIDSVGPIEQGFSGNGLECAEEDADLATAAPDLARTVVWLWEQNQQQQAEIERLKGGVK